MLKRVLSVAVASILICSTVLFCTVLSAGAATTYHRAMKTAVGLVIDSSNACVNREIVQIDPYDMSVTPVLQDGQVLLPVKFVTEKLGAYFAWDPETGTATIITNKSLIKVRAGSREYTVNRVLKYMSTPAKLVGSTFMLPADVLADMLGKTLFVDDASKLVVISNTPVLTNSDTEAIAAIAEAIKTGKAPEMIIAEHPDYSTVQVATPEVPGGGTSNSGGTATTSGGKLTFASIEASSEPQPENGKNNAVDGSLDTRWSAQGDGEWIKFDLGSVQQVSKVGIAWWKSEQRSTNYELEYSEDGSNWKSIFKGESAAGVFGVQYYDLNQKARYFRVIGHGNSENDWNSVLEFEAYGAGGASTTAQSGTKSGKLTFASIEASSEPEPANTKGNAVDGSLDTRWSAQGDGEWIKFDLGSVQQVSKVGIAWWKSEQRSTNYELEYSEDGSNWKSIFKGESPAGVFGVQYYDLNQKARYFRVIGHGNSENDWNSLLEFEAYGAGGASTTAQSGTAASISKTAASTPVGTKTTISSFKVTAEPEPQNPGKNAVDGDMNTVWASQGTNNIVLDLGSVKPVACVGVAFKKYDDSRTIKYDVEISEDGNKWIMVYTGNSVPGGAFEYAYANGTNARYVRVTAYGNTVSGWNSIAEVQVYTK